MDNYTDNPQKSKALRVACYERVSTQEQIHGYSIATQKSNLNDYCKKHGYIVVDHYTDEGISGGKPASRRPAMSRLLRDIEAGLIDLVLFCKLDRWFRNVSEYFKTQEVLDRHGVYWNAVLEDYETETANGRMTVTIMLSVAQNERERTSERIKAVFDYRRAKGEFLTGGQAVPVGYKVEGKYLVKDPEYEPLITMLFRLILSGHSHGSAIRTARAAYPSCNVAFNTLHRTIYKPIYAGIHNGMRDYCPAYISEADHLSIIATAGRRTPSNGHVYLFNGLLVCPDCGRKMVSRTCKWKNTRYVYYSCPLNSHEHTCPNSSNSREDRIEMALVGYLESLFFQAGKKIIVEDVESNPDPVRKTPSTAQIRSRMKRLAETYTDGLIDQDSYKAQLAELRAQLEASKKPLKQPSKPPVELIHTFIQGDFRTAYSGLTEQEKREFWMHVFLSFSIDADYHVRQPVFFEDEF